MKAKGTIRTRIGTSDNSQLNLKLIFTPHEDSIVSSGGKKYVVFVSSDCELLKRELGQGDCPKDCITIDCDLSKHPCLCSASVTVAIGQTLVEVEVKEIPEPDPDETMAPETENSQEMDAQDERESDAKTDKEKKVPPLSLIGITIPASGNR